MLSKACVNILALNMEKVFTIFVEYLANCGASSISNIFPHLDEYATEPKKHYHKQWKNNKKLYFKQKARRPHRLLEQQFYYIFYISISKISNMKFIRIIVKLWKTHIFQDLTNKKNKQYKEWNPPFGHQMY